MLVNGMRDVTRGWRQAAISYYNGRHIARYRLLRGWQQNVEKRCGNSQDYIKARKYEDGERNDCKFQGTTNNC